MDSGKSLADQHSHLQELVFRMKVLVLTMRRFIANLLLNRTLRFKSAQDLIAGKIITTSETVLWGNDDVEDNWILTAGKIQNLRIAARRLHGLIVPANQTFSFWQHIGRPAKARGYVIGRELREGCIVPTIAGGLCQLSNALYDAALNAGFRIIERHRHTKVIKGSLAEIGRDATVKWNYKDLQFSSPNTFQIHVELTSEKLIVRFVGETTNLVAPSLVTRYSPARLNDCFSCGNVECARHPNLTSAKQKRAVTTFILDERWPEYEVYLKNNACHGDHVIVPFSSKAKFRVKRFTWEVPDAVSQHAVPFSALMRSIYLRTIKKRKNVFQSLLHLDDRVAQAMIKYIPIECTHLVIAQNLLPAVWSRGILGGRTFDVLMSRLPMETLHRRLDSAFQSFPESPTLKDFRAPDSLVAAESLALTRSRKVITPHAEIAKIFVHKSILLEWKTPTTHTTYTPGNNILFPASALGRKGAYEVRRLAQELKLSLRILGAANETDMFWEGIATERTSDVLQGVRLVIYPAYIEHQPRVLLKALSLGVPVIASDACGLTPMENLTIIPSGDYIALKAAVVYHLAFSNNVTKQASLSTEYVSK